MMQVLLALPTLWHIHCHIKIQNKVKTVIPYSVWYMYITLFIIFGGRFLEEPTHHLGGVSDHSVDVFGEESKYHVLVPPR